MANRITLEVTRYHPAHDEKPRLESYEVPLRKEWVILDALNYIKDHLDGSLTFRWSCRMGVCGSCGMTVNGGPKLTCATCLLCDAACPVYGLDPLFSGPAAIALAQRYNLDSRDEGASERLDILSQHRGIWGGTFVGGGSDG